MEVSVDDRIELFDQLLRVAELASAEGVPLRLIGGAAMQLWGRIQEEARSMTSDLDWVLTLAEIPTEESARERLESLVGALRTLGFERPSDWRPSRSGRFQFQHEDGRIDVEFLCGDLPFGRASRREPAYRVAPLADGADPPAFYAARTPWVDKILRWHPLQVVADMRSAEVYVPDLASMTLLKLKAVADKLARLEVERDPERLEYERTRLQRHAEDFLSLVRWVEGRGELVVVLDLVRGDRDVASVTLEAEGRAAGLDPGEFGDARALVQRLGRFARVARSAGP